MAITKVIAKVTGCCFCWIVEATQPTPGSFGTVAGVGAVAQGVASAGQLSGSANVAGVPGAQPQTPVVVVASAYQPRASAGALFGFGGTSAAGGMVAHISGVGGSGGCWVGAAGALDHPTQTDGTRAARPQPGAVIGYYPGL